MYVVCFGLFCLSMEWGCIFDSAYLCMFQSYGFLFIAYIQSDTLETPQYSSFQTSVKLPSQGQHSLSEHPLIKGKFFIISGEMHLHIL